MKIPRTISCRKQRGYALIIMLFMTALLLVTVATASLRITTDAKREKEEEMIWRGKQYVRGIRMYYRKTGKFPTSLDDLSKPKLSSIRFMRQAYKDPMNREDGSWRLLYVGPAGQIIGSLKPQHASVQLGGLGTPAAVVANASNQPGATFGPGSAPSPGFNPTPGSNQNNQPSPNPGQPGTEAIPSESTDSSNLQPVGATATTTIIGGNIIGVASKVNEKSVKYYDKANKYLLFEFYWDPSKDAAAALQGMQNSPGLGQNLNGQPRQNSTPQRTPPLQNPDIPPLQQP